MGLKRKRENVSTFTHFYISSLSVSTATIITHPIDVVKVWMQMETKSNATKEAFSLSRFISYYPKIYSIHGIRGFYSGIGAALARAMSYGGARLGLYEPLYTNLAYFDILPQSMNVLTASLLSGCLASFVGNPFEVIKVRMQSDVNKYPNLMVAMHDIITNEGVWRFWRGLIPSMTRSSLLTASQIGPYSWSKGQIGLLMGMNDESVMLHLAASLFAGIVSTTVTSPADVIKTRVMNEYKQGRIDLMRFGREMLKSEGGMSLFRGWMANYIRLGPQTTAIFVAYEQFCSLFNVDGF